jgi:hypothetical protein
VKGKSGPKFAIVASSYRSCSGCRSFFKRAGNLLRNAKSISHSFAYLILINFSTEQGTSHAQFVLNGTRDYSLVWFCHRQLDEEQSQDSKYKRLNKPNKDLKRIKRYRYNIWYEEHDHNQKRLPGKDVSKKTE